MTDRWRCRELAGEAQRNVGATPVAALLLAGIVAVAVAAGVALDANEARRARTQLAQQVVDGGWVTVARSTGGIDAGSCRRLARQRQALAAGGVAKPASMALASAPGTLFETYGATPELIDVLTPRDRGPSVPGRVAVGAALARELGLVDGSHIALGARGRFSVVILPVAMRTSRFSRALLVPEVLTSVEECWVEWVPGTDDVRTLTESLLPIDRPITVSSTLTASASAGTASDPFARYAHRFTRWWFVAVGLVAALVMAARLRSRARHRALYAALGTSRAELAALEGIEAVLITTAGMVVGLACGLAQFAWGGEMTGSDAALAVRQAAFVPAAAVLLTVVVVGLRRGAVAAELKAD